MWSSSRPGRGDEDLDAGAHDRQLLLDVDAAVDDGRAQVRVLARRCATASSTWIASSRVGVRISARTGWRAGDGLVLAIGASFCRIGSAKPAVLPVPVWAPPMTSRAGEDRRGSPAPGSAWAWYSRLRSRPATTRAAGRARQSSLRALDAPGRGPSLVGISGPGCGRLDGRWRDAGTRPEPAPRNVPRRSRSAASWAVTGTAARIAHYSLSFGFCEIFLAREGRYRAIISGCPPPARPAAPPDASRPRP